MPGSAHDNRRYGNPASTAVVTLSTPPPRVFTEGFLGLALGQRLENAQELSHAADEQTLLVNLHPGAGRGWKDDVIARLHRHLYADLLPPVEPRAHSEHDSLLRRRVVATGRYDQAGPPYAVLIELLHDHPVEQRLELVPDRLQRPMVRSRAHARQDIRANH